MITYLILLQRRDGTINWFKNSTTTRLMDNTVSTSQIGNIASNITRDVE
jgi:hypothetical protein